MRKEIIISGFGGQGIMLAGTILCYAGMRDGKHVTTFPSYGAEMRGGTANCKVIISTKPIGSPVIYNPDILLSFNKPSWNKFAPKIKENGVAIINSSLFKPDQEEETRPLEIPANEIAEKSGSVIAANTVMLGALSAKTEIVSMENLEKAICDSLGGKKKSLIEMNIAAARRGYEYAEKTSLKK